MSEEWKNRLNQVSKKWEKKNSAFRDEASSLHQHTSLSSEDNQQVNHENEDEGRRRYVESRLRLRKKRLKKAHENFSKVPVVNSKFSLIAPQDISDSRGYAVYSCQRCHISTNGITKNVSKGGIINLLELPMLQHRKMFLGFFPHVGFVCSRKSLSYSKLQHADVLTVSVKKANEEFQSHSRTLGDPKGHSNSVQRMEQSAIDYSKEVSDRAKSIYVNMRADLSNGFLRLVAWILLKAFGVCYTNLCFQYQDIEMIRQETKRKLPVIYLPLHKSHLDYLIISLMLFCNDLRVPHTAAGDNLGTVPFLGYVLRRVGAFFIRRRNSGRPPADIAAYNAVLQEYTEQLLKHKESITVFIEGTRTRCGKPLQPRTGLLSCVTQAVLTGTIPDALVVPVGISYDVIPEYAGYANEAIGAPKKPESILQLFRGALKMFRSHRGQIRINFGKPFSVQDFCSRQRSFATEMYAESSRTSESSANLQSLLCMTENMTETTRALAYHVITDSEIICNQMATNMVAFLMLNKHRDSVSLANLVDSFEWLREELISLNRRFGFTCDSETAVKYAVQLLWKANMLSVSDNSVDLRDETIVMLPGSLNDHLGLVQHGNQVAPAFIKQAILGCAMISCMGGMKQLDILKCARSMQLSGKQVNVQGKWLAELLQREFVVWPPCSNVDDELEEAMCRFVSVDMVRRSQDQTPMTERERNLARSFNIHEEFENDDWNTEIERDVEYEVSLTEENIEMLKFYHGIICPFLESYWLAATHLMTLLPDREMDLARYQSEIHKLALDRVTSGLSLFAEVASSFPLKNAVQRFEDKGIIKIVNDHKTKRTIQLSNSYSTQNSLVSFIYDIDKFR